MAPLGVPSFTTEYSASRPSRHDPFPHASRSRSGAACHIHIHFTAALSTRTHRHTPGRKIHEIHCDPTFDPLDADQPRPLLHLQLIKSGDRACPWLDAYSHEQHEWIREAFQFHSQEAQCLSDQDGTRLFFPIASTSMSMPQKWTRFRCITLCGCMDIKSEGDAVDACPRLSVAESSPLRARHISPAPSSRRGHRSSVASDLVFRTHHTIPEYPR